MTLKMWFFRFVSFFVYIPFGWFGNNLLWPNVHKACLCDVIHHLKYFGNVQWTLWTFIFGMTILIATGDFKHLLMYQYASVASVSYRIFKQITWDREWNGWSFRMLLIGQASVKLQWSLREDWMIFSMLLIDETSVNAVKVITEGSHLW